MIRLVDIAKRYGERRLLDGISVHFSPGERYGLVGANGAGKSTLLNIMTGVDSADAGDVILPSQCRVAYLPQVPNPHPAVSLLLECMTGDPERNGLRLAAAQAAERLGESYSLEQQEEFESLEARARHADAHLLEAEACALLAGLGFKASDVTRHPLEFSGGWRMRLELAKILLLRPEFLVLDEPTNHLDLPAIAWLESRLMGMAGCLVFVSHDRALLNRLATRILHLRRGRLSVYTGGFDAFLEASAREDEQLERRVGQLAAEADRLEDFARRYGAKATLAARARSKLRMAEKLRELENELAEDRAPAERSMALRIPIPPACGRDVLVCRNLGFGHASRLTDPLSMTIERGQRVAVIGPNGAGKSTLLRTIVGDKSPVSGEVRLGRDVVLSYFAQEQAEVLPADRTALQVILESSPSMEPRGARELLGSLLFSGDAAERPIGVLSGGEKNRVGLARLLASDANLLVLDEPTNHLDMTSVEVLSLALAAYAGSIIFVSHNRDFIDGVCTHVLAVTRCGRVELFEGQLEDYRRACARTGFPDVLSTESAAAPVQAGTVSTPATKSGALGNARRGERTKLRKDIDRLEARMAEIEKVRLRIEAALAQCAGGDYQEAQRLGSELAMLGTELSAAEDSWVKAHECLEELEKSGSS